MLTGMSWIEIASAAGGAALAAAVSFRPLFGDRAGFRDHWAAYREARRDTSGWLPNWDGHSGTADGHMWLWAVVLVLGGYAGWWAAAALLGR